MRQNENIQIQCNIEIIKASERKKNLRQMSKAKKGREISRIYERYNASG